MENSSQSVSAPVRCLGCMAPDSGAAFCPACGWQRTAGAASVLHLEPGTLLQNTYLVGRALGQGGFGITYIGWDMQLQRRVAIKEFFPQVLASRMPGASTVTASGAQAKADFQHGLQGFLNEGRILARFSDHPCIVSVLNLFEANRTGYLVMGYLDGVTLARMLTGAGGRLPYEAAREIMMRVMDGLREVHAQGLLHRDISPDNIYITNQGLVKILDFGAARFEAGERSHSLSVVLKEGFAPEEQYRRSGHQGAWTDVYATAATLYKCIAGVTPPPALDRLHEDSLKSPRELGVTMPAAAEGALMRALALRAGDRFQSIESFQEGLAGTARPAEPTTGLLSTSTPSQAAPGKTHRINKIPAGVWMAIFAAVLITALIAGGYRFLPPKVVFGKNQVRYEGSATKEQAEALGESLRKIGYFGDRGAEVILSKAPGATTVTFIVQDGTWNRPSMIASFEEICRQIAPSVGGFPIQARLADTGRKVMKQMAIGRIYVAPASSGDPAANLDSELYYYGSATEAEAEAMGAALRMHGFPSNQSTMFLAKGSEGTVITFVVRDGYWLAPKNVDAFAELVRKVAPSVGGLPVTLHLSDVHLSVQKSVVVEPFGLSGSRATAPGFDRHGAPRAQVFRPGEGGDGVGARKPRHRYALCSRTLL